MPGGPFHIVSISIERATSNGMIKVDDVDDATRSEVAKLP